MSSRKQKKPKFNTILFQAVYEGLNSIGSSIPSAILSYLEKDGSIGPGRVINDPQTFDEGLKKIFGFGAKVIEKKILESLYEKLRIQQAVQDNFSFPEEIQNVQKSLPSAKVHVLLPETANV
jgi:hypothetical protein